MSQDENTRTSGNADAPITTPPIEGSVENVPSGGGDDPQAPTIGTGTALALGCVAGTILLIVIGLLYVFLLTVF